VTPPELLAGPDDTILVEFSQFVLQEAPAQRTAQAIGVPSEGRRSLGGPGGIVFLSQASDHYPSVRIEVWSSRPEAGAARWDATEELTTNLTDDVRLRSRTMEISDKILPLPRPGDYAAIVHVNDDPQTDQLEEGSFAHTAERWLVQLWPIASSATGQR